MQCPRPFLPFRPLNPRGLLIGFVTLLPDPSSLPRTGRRSQTTEECLSSGLQAAVLAPSTYAMPVPLPRGFA